MEAHTPPNILSPTQIRNPDPLIDPNSLSDDEITSNRSLTSEFKLNYETPDLDLFELNPPLHYNSEVNAMNGKLITDETLDDKSGSSSIKSLVQLNKHDNRRYKSDLAKESWKRYINSAEIKADKNLAKNALLRLKSLEFDNYVINTNRLDSDTGSLVFNPNDEDNNNQHNTKDIDISNLSKASINHCNCKKSKCLRLHCICFADLRECSDMCNCTNCKNNQDFKEVRDFVIEKTKEINPLAFKPKIKSFKGMNVNSRGCNCAKNNCIKKYCECYKSGSSCTELCTCSHCKNSKEKLNEEEITDLKDRGYRKKHKIVINESDLQKRENSGIGDEVKFVKHKKKRKVRNCRR